MRSRGISARNAERGQQRERDANGARGKHRIWWNRGLLCRLAPKFRCKAAGLEPYRRGGPLRGIVSCNDTLDAGCAMQQFPAICHARIHAPGEVRGPDSQRHDRIRWPRNLDHAGAP